MLYRNPVVAAAAVVGGKIATAAPSVVAFPHTFVVVAAAVEPSVAALPERPEPSSKVA